MNAVHPFDVRQRVVCVVGPTASGKTALSQELACALDGEVVSADSMQVYRGMDIGTGKLPVQERIVPHYGFDLVDPGGFYSAALFQDYARKCFRDIDARGKRAVLCGGTGFYVRAAIDDYRFPKGEQVGNAVRDRWNEFAKVHGAQALWDELASCDPESANLIAVNDTKRVVRAFELLDDGTSYAQQKSKLAHIPQLVPAVFIGLQVEPELLRQRIDARVDWMFENGFIDEVSGLLEAGFREGVTAPYAIGYREVVMALDGDISMDEAAFAMKMATHRYAKRQRTWFRKDSRIRWVDANEFDAKRLRDEALCLIGDGEGN